MKEYNASDAEAAVGRYLARNAKQGVAATADFSPDAEAKVRQTAARLSMSVSAARELPQETERQDRIEGIDYLALGRDAPRTAAFISAPEHAAIARDDTDAMAALEKEFGVLRAPSSPPATIGNVLKGLGTFAATQPEQIRAGIQRMFADAFGWQETGARAASAASNADFRQELAAPAIEGNIGKGLYGFGESAIQAVPVIAASVLNPALGLGLLGAQTQAPAYSKYRNRGASPAAALLASVAEGGVEIATEKNPLKFLSQRLGKAGPGEFVKDFLVKELGGEVTATILQGAIDKAVANPDKTWSDYFKELPDALVQTAVGTLAFGGVAGAANVAAARFAKKDEAAQQAVTHGDALERIAAVPSKLKERDPETFRRFVEAAAADGDVTDVYIDAEGFAQSGVDPATLAELVPALADQLPGVLAGVSDMRIPIADYAATVAGTDAGTALLDHIRTDPLGMTRKEGREFAQSGMEAFEKEAEAALAERKDDEPFKKSAEAVKVDIGARLNALGRFSKDANEKYSTLLGSFYTVQAARLGVTPEEFYAANPVNFAAETEAAVAVPRAERLQQYLNSIDDIELRTLRNLEAAKAAQTPVNEDLLSTLQLKQATRKELSKAKKTKPVSLLAFLKKQGGVNASSMQGDVSAIGIAAKRFPGLLSGKGKTLDYAREAAAEAGYLSQDSTVEDLLALIADEAGGKKQFSVKDQGAVADIQTASERLDELERILADAGIDNESAAIAGLRQKIKRNEAAASQAEAARQAGESEAQALRRFALSQGDANQRGFFRPDTNTIGLLANADLTTFLHELGHFYLETLNRLALAPNAPQEIRDDMQKVLAWFGVPDLAAWNALSLEEQRENHEKFARGFERYLFEGKAPSRELRGVFRLFRAWLMNVYRSLRALNVELTDDVRGVFDRLIATAEQIKEAEAQRAFSPLFKTAEDAGMGADEFGKYSTLGVAATRQAVEDLQRRSLADMKWLSNGKGRIIKGLQKEAANKRSGIRAEVEAEVYSRPIYQAWQFVRFGLLPLTPEQYAARSKATGESAKLAHAAAVKKWREERDAAVAKSLPRSLKKDFRTKKKPEEIAAKREELEKKWERKNKKPVFKTPKIGDTADGEHKFSLAALKETYGDGEDAAWRKLPAPVGKETDMVSAEGGLAPNTIAEEFGFSSGDELIKKLAKATPPAALIRQLTDQRMMERYGGMPDADALERAADEAIHNKARARFIAREANALQAALGERKIMNDAARVYAEGAVDATRVRDLSPARYEAQEERAARKAVEAFKKGELPEAAAQKRNQLVNHHAAAEALRAQRAIDKQLKYFRRFDKKSVYGSIDGEYVEQIKSLLERFDLRRGVTLKEIEKRKSFAAWYAKQVEAGLTPDVPEYLLNDAARKSYKDLTVEEMRGLYESVKQIAHLGRMKNKLLTARDQRTYDEAVEAMTASIAANSGGRKADNRSRPGTGEFKRRLEEFIATHRKFSNLVRELDGWQDGGPVWDNFIRSANERGDQEAAMRADAAERLAAISAPILDGAKMGGKGVYYETLGISLNREERIGIALNMGNAGNKQRLLDGEGWTMEQIRPVLDGLTREEAAFVQKTWDFFESYRPLIGAKEKRVYGVEPDWVAPVPVNIGGTELPGGYYPVKYDPRRNQDASENDAVAEAERQMEGAFTSATTRRSFTKKRAEEVKGRPLLYTLDALFQGTNDVIHDLAWHEWLIDINKFMRSRRLDSAMRETYGAEHIKQMKAAIVDIARGDAPETDALEKTLAHLRHGSVIAAMGFNITNAIINVTGLTQSFYRVGGKWMAQGIGEWARNPAALTREVYEKSSFMRSRSKTFNREVNEIQSVLRGKSSFRQGLDRLMFLPMFMTQIAVDVPTWKGAYNKAIAQDVDEAKSVALADQAVIDAQGSGQIKDLAAIQRGSGYKKLFTAFYGYFSTTFNLSVEAVKQTDFKDPQSVMRLGGNYLLLYALPAALGTILKAALTPGDDPEDIAKKLAGDQISYLFAAMVGVREASAIGQRVLGAGSFGYGGPAGLRFLQSLDRLAQQAGQGEADRALTRSLIDVAGIALHLPSGQMNRTIDGIAAIADGKTSNPLAVVAGAPKR